MKHIKNKHNMGMNRFSVKCIAIVITLLGIGLSAVSMINYSKGYFAFHAVSNVNQTDAIADNTDNTAKVSLTRDELKDRYANDMTMLYSSRPQIGDDIGELYIPKLKATLPIFHGTSDDELEKGVGHYANSVLPGENDNCVLSGHRDTVFRKLGDVGVGDLFVTSTSAGEFTYKVKKVRIVNANDRTVIVPKPKATLTVSTCYPFHYIGSAPKRYILEAYLVQSKLNN